MRGQKQRMKDKKTIKEKYMLRSLGKKKEEKGK